MSNLKELLQNEIYNTDKELYNKIKYQEYISLVDLYKQNDIDKDYEIYFNNKCINDYKYSLLSEISNIIEKKIINEKDITKILLYKFIFKLQLKIQNNKLKDF